MFLFNFSVRIQYFKWRDYKDGNKVKTMILTAGEFIRRFLMHVLPSGFRKIRHYGILAPRNKSKIISLCRKLTRTRLVIKIETLVEKLIRLFGADYNLCPVCKEGRFNRASPRDAPYLM